MTVRLYIEACKRLGVRTVIERLRRLAFNLTNTFGCEACSCEWPNMFPYMVDDELWQEVVGDEEAHLCLSCFEERMQGKLGRGLGISDFTDAPLNAPIMAGIRTATRM